MSFLIAEEEFNDLCFDFGLELDEVVGITNVSFLKEQHYFLLI